MQDSVVAAVVIAVLRTDVGMTSNGETKATKHYGGYVIMVWCERVCVFVCEYVRERERGC